MQWGKVMIHEHAVQLGGIWRHGEVETCKLETVMSANGALCSAMTNATYTAVQGSQTLLTTQWLN